MAELQDVKNDVRSENMPEQAPVQSAEQSAVSEQPEIAVPVALKKEEPTTL